MKKVLSIIMLLYGTLAHLQAQEQEMKVHFIDMGQGLSTLLQFPNGIVLIDAGSQILGGKKISQQKVVTYLSDFFTDNPQYNWTIDAIIVTHNHQDHTGTIPILYKDERFKIRNLVSTLHKLGADVKKPAKDSSINHFWVEYTDVLANLPNGITNNQIDPCGNTNGVDPEIKIFSGRNKGAKWNKRPLNNPNFHSLAVRVKFGDASFLFIGDMQEEAIDYMLEKYEDHLDVFDVDVYQVGHHGSHNATTEPLLDAMTPKIAVISASNKKDTQKGSGFAYGHPNIHVLEMLSESVQEKREEKNGYGYEGASSLEFNTRISKKITKAIYCTCWDGTVVLKATSTGEYAIE
jgi:competence protein ComEC